MDVGPLLGLLLGVLLLVSAMPVRAARLADFLPQAVVSEIFPGADRIGQPQGEPPLAPVFSGDRQIGHVYLNADVTDAAGETRTGNRALVMGRNPISLRLLGPEEADKRRLPEFRLFGTNATGEPLPVAGTLRLLARSFLPGLPDPLAEREWRLLRELAEAGLPTAEVVGVVTGRIVTVEYQVVDVEAALGRGEVPRLTERSSYVYKRGGMPCEVCGSKVRTRLVAGRNLFWCGRCQRRR